MPSQEPSSFLPWMLLLWRCSDSRRYSQQEVYCPAEHMKSILLCLHLTSAPFRPVPLRLPFLYPARSSRGSNAAALSSLLRMSRQVPQFLPGRHKNQTPETPVFLLYTKMSHFPDELPVRPLSKTDPFDFVCYVFLWEALSVPGGDVQKPNCSEKTE